jgi:hypothetical protein
MCARLLERCRELATAAVTDGLEVVIPLGVDSRGSWI